MVEHRSRLLISKVLLTRGSSSMKRTAIICGLAVAAALPVAARLTFTQRIQQQTGNKVVLRQDQSLTLLVDGRAADPVAPSKGTSQPSAKSGTASSKSGSASGKSGTTTSKPSTTTPSSSTTTKSPSSTPSKPSGYTMQAGWRVKFFTGGGSREDKENAQAAGREFKRHFPEVSVYMHFVSPHWICLAGDFVSKEEAEAFVQKVSASGLYGNTALNIVRCKIKVPIE